MSGVFWRMDLSGPDWKDASQRSVKRAAKAALLFIAIMWQKNFLRLHFEPGNAARYNYQPRKPEYLRRKARAGSTVKNAYGRSSASFSKVAGGGVIDLVRSGQLRRTIMQNTTVTSYPTRATVKLVGPSYFTLRPRNPSRPNLAREILTISDDERDILRQNATKEFVIQMRNAPPRGRPRKRFG